MSKAASLIALLSSQALPAFAAESEVPEWIHLLPTGSASTYDKRGPYNVADLQSIIDKSLVEGGKLPIDQDHATDLAAPKGGPAPARGWIVEMQARDDGVWGRVEWTTTGRSLLAERAYSSISPVIAHTKGKDVVAILRASLVNRPNLQGLTALNSENPEDMETGMTLMERLAKLVGLEPTATEDEVMAALEAKMAEMTAKPDEAMQSALNEIGTALGVQDGDTAAILNAAKGAGTETTALQSQIATMTTQIGELQTSGKKTAAEAYIDGAIADLRVGLNSANREEFIAMHMENPERTEKLVSGFPKMNTNGDPETAVTTALQGATTGDVVEKARAYQAKQKTAGNDITFTVACLAVQEGKE